MFWDRVIAVGEEEEGILWLLIFSLINFRAGFFYQKSADVIKED